MMESKWTASDGFETGDFRNFAPVYLGTESKWIRPKAGITDENPITGEYSLRWSADEDPHRWTLVSNAFYLDLPVTVTVSLRVDGPPGEPYAAGVGIAETQSRAAVLRASGEDVELAGDAWDGEAVATADGTLDRGTVYELAITLDDGVSATVRAGDDHLAELLTDASLEPNAIGLYVDTVAGGETTLTFDDVTVESAPYRVRSDQWTRAPQFVVLPRAPDVGEDQGNWVGAPSVIDDGDRYRMWYRIRNNEDRGAGYGLAESEDGFDWEKHANNPVLIPDHGQDSNEGISVLRVDDTYHGWYTIDKDGTWHIVHVTSENGVDWTDHGIVIEGYCKDPSVIYVDGTYYLYAIAPSSTQFSVYTSTDGDQWTRQNKINLGSHGHPGVYYVEETETFWLYVFAEEGSASPATRVRRAASPDGIDFGDLEPTWHDPPVGLDYRPPGGVDYGAFPGDEHRHLPDDRQIPMYYQARHDYLNNRPNWQMAGDGVVVLGGRFSGLFADVPTTVDEHGYRYHEFPMHAEPVRRLSAEATDPVVVTVAERIDADGTINRGTIETEEGTTLSITATQLAPGSEYSLLFGEDVTTTVTDADGVATFDVVVPAGTDETFELRRSN